jgi:hypothetical protein
MINKVIFILACVTIVVTFALLLWSMTHPQGIVVQPGSIVRMP